MMNKKSRFVDSQSFILLSAFIAFNAHAKLEKTDFTTWPKAHAKDFGCFLEKQFAMKDQKFNCSLKKYKPSVDPCKDSYNDGPVFPTAKATQVNDQIQSIDLAWEHGDLQSVNITLKKKWKEDDARSQFHLPKDASIQDCSKTATCIVLTGFDHLGAGDVDCGR